MKKIVTVFLVLLSMAGCGQKPHAGPAAEFVVKPAPKLSAETMKQLRDEQARRRAEFKAKRAADAPLEHPSTAPATLAR